MTLSAVALADEWVPIRPGTDAAMMTAMAYVMITEGLHDAGVRARRTASASTRPRCRPGAKGAESYADYILGTRDGSPKTPEWAEPITGVAARDDRPHRPRVRHDQARRALPGLRHAAPGLWRAGGARRLRAGGHHRQRRRSGRLGQRTGAAGARRRAALERLPDRHQPGQGLHPDLPLDRGRPARASSSGRRTACAASTRLDNDIKLIYAVASNALVNQHANINRTAKILRDETPGRVHRRPGQLPDADRAVRRHRAAGLHPVRDVGRGGRLEVRRRGHPDAEAGRAARRDEERLPDLRRDCRAAGHRRRLHRRPRRARTGSRPR